MGRDMIAAAVLAAIAQLGDRRFLGVLAIGLGLTIALLLGFYLGFVALLGSFLPGSFSLPWIGEIDLTGAVIGLIGLPVILLMSTVLMIPVATAFMGLFLDQIADAVEERHYPGLPPARRIGLIEGLGDAARFLGVVLAVNLVALIAYVLFAPVAPILFWVVNGYLLGREYGQMVALRRTDTAGAKAFRRANSGRLFIAGVAMAVPLTIPVINLLVPILGAASFTHLYHKISATRPSRSGYTDRHPQP
jgi:CysZ protein